LNQEDKEVVKMVMKKFMGPNRAKASKTVNVPSKTPSRNEAHPMGMKRATPGMTLKADMKV